jgi:hypothetical protein
MPFRNDTDALRSRVEVLEADLKRAEADLASSRREATDADALRAALLKIEAQLAEVRGERVNPRAQRTAAMGLASGMALVVAGAMVAQSTLPHVPVRRRVPVHTQPVLLPSAQPMVAFAPRLLRADVYDSLGDAPVATNAQCDVLVAATDSESLNCRVTITQAFKVIVPTREELRELMGVEDEDEMLVKARESLEQANADHEHRRQESALLEQLIDAHAMDLPGPMVEDQVAGRLNALRNELEGQGLVEDKVSEEVSVQEPQIRAEAVKGAKAYFLVEVIAEKEDLQVTQPELQAELKLIAQRNRSPLEEVQKYYQEENLIPQLALEIVERKVRVFLREAANVSGGAAESE